METRTLKLALQKDIIQSLVLYIAGLKTTPCGRAIILFALLADSLKTKLSYLELKDAALGTAFSAKPIKLNFNCSRQTAAALQSVIIVTARWRVGGTKVRAAYAAR